jgi:hypothetical protein
MCFTFGSVPSTPSIWDSRHTTPLQLGGLNGVTVEIHADAEPILEEVASDLLDSHIYPSNSKHEYKRREFEDPH